MLQPLFLDVSKVYRVLYMGCVWEAAGSTDDVGGDVGDVRGSAGLLLVCSLASTTRCLSAALGGVLIYSGFAPKTMFPNWDYKRNPG